MLSFPLEAVKGFILDRFLTSIPGGCLLKLQLQTLFPPLWRESSGVKQEELWAKAAAVIGSKCISKITYLHIMHVACTYHVAYIYHKYHVYLCTHTVKKTVPTCYDSEGTVLRQSQRTTTLAFLGLSPLRILFHHQSYGLKLECPLTH